MCSRKREPSSSGDRWKGGPGRFHRPLRGGPARLLCACRISKRTPVLPAVPGRPPVQEADRWPGPEATLGLSAGPGTGSQERCLRTLRFPGDRPPPDKAMWRLEPRGSPQKRSHPHDFSSLVLAVSLCSLNTVLPCGESSASLGHTCPSSSSHRLCAQHPLRQSFPLTISMTELFHL